MKALHTLVPLLGMLAVAALALSACGDNDIVEPVSPGEVKPGSEEMEIDSTTSRFKFDYEYNDNVVEFSANQTAWLDSVDNVIVHPSVIYFNPDTPMPLLPDVGQVIVMKQGSRVFQLGYMGRVTAVETQSTGRVAVHVEDAQLEDVYKTLDMDICLNAEQLRAIPHASVIYDNATAEQVTADEFFDGADACRSEYLSRAAESEDVNVKPMFAVEAGKDSEDKSALWKSASISFASSDKGISLTLEHRFTSESIGNVHPYVKGKATLTPMGVQCRTIITDSQVQKQERKLTYALDFDVLYGLEGRPEGIYQFRSPEKYAITPVAPTPINIEWHFITTYGLYGSVNMECKINNRVYCVITTIDGEHGMPDIKFTTNQSWGGGLNFTFPRLTLDGGFFFEPIVAANILGIPFAVSYKPRFQLGGSVDLLDRDLYRKNPKLSLDLTSKAGIYYMKDPFDFTKQGINYWHTFPTISMGEFPIFPQIDNPIGLHKQGNTAGMVKYESSPLYLLYPMFLDEDAILNHTFVSSRWMDSPQEQYVVDTRLPVALQHKGLTTLYSAATDRLAENGSYYDVPTVEIFGFMKYYGKPIPLRENEAKRICAMGPDYQQSVDGDRLYVTIGYDEDGAVKRVNNSLAESETSVSRDPLVIRSHEYSMELMDNKYVKKYIGWTCYADANVDDKSGVLKSCRWYDTEDRGTVRFSYDDQYHLVGMSNGGTDGWSIATLEWNDRGCLTKVIVKDNTGETTTFDYTYRDDDLLANVQGCWTLATGYAFDFLAYGHFIGRAPAHLPTHMKMTFVEKDANEGWTTSVQDVILSYTQAGSMDDRYIESEKWSITDWPDVWHRGDTYNFTFPYAYRSVSLSDTQKATDDLLGVTRSADVQAASLRRVRIMPGAGRALPSHQR